jgi:putative tryptophan/tyrosine transport system substrate-binding protein
MGSLPLTLFFRAARLAPRLLSLSLSVSLAAFTAPAHAEAPSRKPARVGWASLYPDPQVKTLLDAFRAGLVEHGFMEGKNLEIITRSGEGSRERMPAAIEELVSLKPDLIVTHAAATFSARQVTTLPVVFGFSGDPIIAELTDSLARPSRNLTGVSFMQVELNEKRLDLLHQIAPKAKMIVLMGDPVHPGADLEVQATEKIATQLGIVVRWRPTRNSAAVQDLLAELDRSPPDALVILPDAVMLENRERVAEFAIRHRIPAVSGWAVFADGGGLFTYGPRLSESFRRLAYFVTRIVEGASPSELPIEQPTIFELVVNLKTANALGLTIPPTLLARADEVIE